MKRMSCLLLGGLLLSGCGKEEAPPEQIGKAHV